MTQFFSQTSVETQFLNQDVVDGLQALLNAHDRGGFYMDWYQHTDSQEALLQARISTFSGTQGGVALCANMIMQHDLGSRYPGIFPLSQSVAEKAFALLDGDEAPIAYQEQLGIQKVNPPGYPADEPLYRAPTDSNIFASAEKAWKDAELAPFFPGNILTIGELISIYQNTYGDGTSPVGQTMKVLIDAAYKIMSPGSSSVISSLLSFAPTYFGRSDSDFLSLPGYSIRNVKLQVHGIIQGQGCSTLSSCRH